MVMVEEIISFVRKWFFMAILDALSCVLETAKCMDLEPPFGIAQVGEQLLLLHA